MDTYTSGWADDPTGRSWRLVAMPGHLITAYSGGDSITFPSGYTLREAALHIGKGIATLDRPPRPLDNERLRGVVTDAVALIDLLAEQQAMSDDWYMPERDRIALAAEGGATSNPLHFVLPFDPGHIREHYEGTDDNPTKDWIDSASDEQLREVGTLALEYFRRWDTIWNEYAECLNAAIREHLDQKEATP